jgi:hypothetical protein
MGQPPGKTIPNAAATPSESNATPGNTENPAGWEDLSETDRYRMIAEAAYFRAERRGFIGGSELQDWIEAVEEVRKRFTGT